VSTRETLQRRSDRATAAMMVFAAIGVSSYLLLKVNGVPDWSLLLGMFSMLVAAFFCTVANRRSPCPRCGSNLSRSFVRPLPFFGQTVRYCPYCGLDLESVNTSENGIDGLASR